MANIWKENQDVNEHPNRNNFDLRYQNHLTMKMGTLYPIMCKEVVPGDSFKIDTAFGLKFMPLVFPIQSSMKAYVHYFYVPNRILWKNWKNFISGLGDHVHPYVTNVPIKTGTLTDYLDVPTTVVENGSQLHTDISRTTGLVSSVYNNGSDARNGHISVTSDGRISFQRDSVTVEGNGLFGYMINGNWKLLYPSEQIIDVGHPATQETPPAQLAAEYMSRTMYFYDYKLSPFNYGSLDFSQGEYPLIKFEVANSDYVTYNAHSDKYYLLFWNAPKTLATSNILSSNSGTTRALNGMRRLAYHEVALEMQNGWFNVQPAPDTAGGSSYLNFKRVLDTVNDIIYQGDTDVYMSLVVERSINAEAVGIDDLYDSQFPPAHYYTSKDSGFIQMSGRFQYVAENQYVSDAGSNPFEYTKFDEPAIRLNALPFRAYESVYNAYYRNTQNQPFVVDGETVYNQYNTTLEDGEDATPYRLFRRNYELDFLTSAMPSPQFGVAPLVGMTALGEVTIEDENGITTARAEIDDDGTITNVVLTSPAASIDHARTAMNIASSGMSINDFRNVNALQRFLETTLRKGYKYKDFIEGHFGSAPRQIELDMPEFIGGTSQQVNVNMVSNVTSGDAPLGSFAGTAQCFGATNHSVTKYIDDYGYIIGIMCIVPTPAYSQLLPKHFLHSKQLDYYFPEFAQLGLQPITLKEVTPIQTFNEMKNGDDISLEDTFGYQRPNYDLVQYPDQVHGLFRTELKDFLINRVFSSTPQLGTEFLEIDSKDINNIFADVDPNSDNIIGQVIIDIKAKRPVPRVTIPSLGR